MKKWIGAALLLPALLGACAGTGQEENEMKDEKEVQHAGVPAAVREAFAQRFPSATEVEWVAEDATTYEAEFREGGGERSANFATDGTWLETESSLVQSALPEAVINAIAALYADHEVEEAEQVETPGGVSYEVELEHKEHTMEVLFAADGTVLSSNVEEDTEKEETHH